MDTKEFKEVIEDAGYSVRSYSGRGMYGEYCIGFTTEDTLAAVAEIMYGATDEMRYEVLSALQSARTDSMGRYDEIVYFPRFTISNDEIHEWDEDEDEDGDN